MLIDKYAYYNRLLNVHPIEKFLYAILTLLLCLFLNSATISITIIILNSVILVYKAGIKADFYLKLLLIPVSFLFIGTATIAFNVITHQEKALLCFNIFNFNIGITQSSFIQAQNIFLKAFGSVSCLYFLALTTPMVDIVSVLRKLKFPELFLELMSLVYRLIFIFIKIAGRIHTSQSSRLGYYGINNSFKSMGYLISSLFLLSYKKADDLYTALEARGYTGKLNVLEKQYKLSKKRIAFIMVFEISLIFLGVIK